MEDIPTYTAKFLETILQPEVGIQDVPPEGLPGKFDVISTFAASYKNKNFNLRLPFKVTEDGFHSLGMKVPQDDFNLNFLGRVYPNADEKFKVFEIDPDKDFSLKKTRAGHIYKTRREISDILKLPLEEQETSPMSVLNIRIKTGKSLSEFRPPKFIEEMNLGSLDSLGEQFYNLRLIESPEDFMDESRYYQVATRNAFTSFHHDYGGTLTYLHVYKGQKIFFLVEPTGGETGKSVKQLGFKFPSAFKNRVLRVVVNQGETLVFPGYYFHAVYTPIPTIVFSGGVLCTSLLDSELLAHKWDICGKNVFPNFEAIMHNAMFKIIDDFWRMSFKKKSPEDEQAVKKAAKAFIKYIYAKVFTADEKKYSKMLVDHVISLPEEEDIIKRHISGVYFKKQDESVVKFLEHLPKQGFRFILSNVERDRRFRHGIHGKCGDLDFVSADRPEAKMDVDSWHNLIKQERLIIDIGAGRCRIKSLNRINEGTVIAEIVGELVMGSCRRNGRITYLHEKLCQGVWIDSNFAGNIGLLFSRNSEGHNCKIIPYNVDGRLRLAVKTANEIPENCELVLPNYEADYDALPIGAINLASLLSRVSLTEATPSTSHGFGPSAGSSPRPPTKKVKRMYFSSYEAFKNTNDALSISMKLGSDICCVCINHSFTIPGRTTRYKYTKSKLQKHFEGYHQRAATRLCTLRRRTWHPNTVPSTWT